MSMSTVPVRIGIRGSAGAAQGGRGCGLWPPGYAAALKAVNATPVHLSPPTLARPWDEILDGVHGVVLAGHDRATPGQVAAEEGLCRWCQERRLPLLGIDQGLHTLNMTFGGSVYLDLARELPEALQHRHPPERGLRHAISV